MWGVFCGSGIYNEVVGFIVKIPTWRWQTLHNFDNSISKHGNIELKSGAAVKPESNDQYFANENNVFIREEYNDSIQIWIKFVAKGPIYINQHKLW